MKKGSYRVFKQGMTHHVFVKAVDGIVLFFTIEDFLYFFTLYSCLARRYHITVRGFSIMPNHIHSNESAPDLDTFLKFHSHLESVYAREYNKWHNRKGKLFQKPFGYAPKTVAKKIRDNISYIANNPVVGALVKNAIDYRWNLLAYYNCTYPFSSGNNGTRALRRAKEMVKDYYKSLRPLGYKFLQSLFRNLDRDEQTCLADYIVSLYNVLDYKSLLSYYKDDFNNMITAFNANSGSEYDIPEDYENYGQYRKMLQIVTQKGLDISHNCFENMDSAIVKDLETLFLAGGISPKQIAKFLHTNCC